MSGPARRRRSARHGTAALGVAGLAWFAAAAAGGCRPRARTPAPPPPPDQDAATPDGSSCTLGGTTAGAPITVACAQGAPGRIAVDGSNVYWTLQAPGAVLMRAP